MSIESITDEAALPPMAGSRMFRSACSGLWYQNPRAAGDIDAVELYGQRLIRHEDETSLAWIHRVAEWSSKLHSENAKDDGRRILDSENTTNAL